MNEEVKVKDLYLSAFLFAKSVHLKRVEREGSVCWFVFLVDETNRDLINKFWSGEALCNAKSYSDAIRTLKDRIFSES